HPFGQFPKGGKIGRIGDHIAEYFSADIHLQITSTYSGSSILSAGRIPAKSQRYCRLAGAGFPTLIPRSGPTMRARPSVRKKVRGDSLSLRASWFERRPACVNSRRLTVVSTEHARPKQSAESPSTLRVAVPLWIGRVTTVARPIAVSVGVVAVPVP